MGKVYFVCLCLTYVFVSCIDIVLTTNSDYNVYHVWVNLLFIKVNPSISLWWNADWSKFRLISRIGYLQNWAMLGWYWNLEDKSRWVWRKNLFGIL